MKRSLLLVVAGLAASACYTSPAPPAYGDLVVYWDFQRNVVPPLALPAPYTCSQGAVDYVVVTDGSGYLLDPTTAYIACAQPNQGLTFLAQPLGAWTVRVRGYRGPLGGGVLVFDGTQTVNVQPNVLNQTTVLAWGVQQNLDLFANLYNTSALSYYQTCAGATVDTVTYTLVDGWGTEVDSANNIVCSGPLPLLFFTGGVDLDNYFVRAAAYQGATKLFDSCSVAFDHFGDQTAQLGVDVVLDNPVPACL